MIIAISNEQHRPYRCLSIAKGLLHASKCVVCEIYHTTAARTKTRGGTVHGQAGKGQVWRWSFVVVLIM